MRVNFETWIKARDNEAYPLKVAEVTTAMGTHLIAELSSHDLSLCQAQVRSHKDLEDINTIWILWCHVNDEGLRTFDPRDKAHLVLVRGFGASITNPLLHKAQALNNGPTQEEAKKNS